MCHCLKVGDIVRLHSCSPDMTVEAVCGETIHCIWFSRCGDTAAWTGPHRAEFSAAVLRKAGQ